MRSRFTAWRWGFWAWLLRASLLVGLLAACAPLTPSVEEAPRPAVRVGVCTSLQPLAEAIALAYPKATGVEMRIGVGPESYILQKAEAGEFDAILVTVNFHDRGKLVAQDALAVVVHPSNPVANLGPRQVRELFTGFVLDWETFGGSGEVMPLTREKGSAARRIFEAEIMGDSAITPAAIVLPSSRAMVDYVSLHPGAIGYVAAARLNGEVKTLAIEGILPSPRTVADGSYPLVIPAYAVPITGEGGKLVEFLTGRVGKRILSSRYALP